MVGFLIAMEGISSAPKVDATALRRHALKHLQVALNGPMTTIKIGRDNDVAVETNTSDSNPSDGKTRANPVHIVTVRNVPQIMDPQKIGCWSAKGQMSSAALFEFATFNKGAIASPKTPVYFGASSGIAEIGGSNNTPMQYRGDFFFGAEAYLFNPVVSNSRPGLSCDVGIVIFHEEIVTAMYEEIHGNIQPKTVIEFLSMAGSFFVEQVIGSAKAAERFAAHFGHELGKGPKDIQTTHGVYVLSKEYSTSESN
jgi:hypothetical protein